MPAGSVEVLKYDRPETRAQAKFSGPYMTACALLYGTPTLVDFEDAAVGRAPTQALMKRVRIVEDVGQASGGDIQFGHVTMTVRQAGWEHIFERSTIPGGPESPPTADEVRSKFHSCVSLIEAERGHAYPVLSEMTQISEANEWWSSNQI